MKKVKVQGVGTNGDRDAIRPGTFGCERDFVRPGTFGITFGRPFRSPIGV